MAPSRKSKTGKRGAALRDVSPDVRVYKKSRKKRPKLDDILGPHWSEQELERFYQGIRKYGSEWKKVSSYVRNRSPEMIEALYILNRAYLSLPEGTASVDGLKAMMTDHYNNLEGNASEGDEDYKGILKAQRPQKYMKRAYRAGFPQEQLLHSQSPKKTESCLSLLKKGMHLHVPVRRRTPRVPIPAIERNGGINSFSPLKSAHKAGVKMDADELAHGAALLLSETSQQIGSSQVSPTTNGPVDDWRLTQVSMGKQIISKSDLLKGKHHGIKMNNESAHGVFDGKGVKDVDFLVGLSLAVYKKEKKGKKHKDGNYKNFHNVTEASSDLSRRLSVDPAVGRFNFEATKARAESSSSHENFRKRSKKLFTEDESLACDALQALADISLALTTSTAEPVEYSRESASGGEITVDSTAVSDATLVNQSAKQGSKKKKQKTSKIQTAEKQNELQSRRPTEEKALAEEDLKSGNRFREHNQAYGDSKHCKPARYSVVPSTIDQEMAEIDVAASSRQNLATDQVVLTTKRKIQRKRERTLITNGILSSSRDLLKKHSSLFPQTTPKDKLSCCLSSPLLRRWCGFEWFYSAIDYPWFAKKEFVEYLNHVGLGHIPRLTRVEWGVIRSSLGKPRRFSRRFLQEEREKLERYRESVRKHYSELRAGLREGLPTDLARPLSVGQRVIAIHPKTREFHDGSILTVDSDKFRVQFDRPELGVEFVMDINCMPCNQLENMPEVMRRQKVSIDYVNSNGQITDGQSMLSFRENMPGLNPWSGTTALSNGALNPAKVDLMPKAGANMLLKTPSTMQVEASGFQVHPSDVDSKGFVHLHNLHNSLAREGLPYISGPRLGRPYPEYLLNGSQLPTNAAAVSGEALRCVSDYEDSASKVAETVRGSREKAQTMVNAAIQAMSFLKEGENAYERIGEAIESIKITQHPSEPGSLNIPSQSVANGNLKEMKVSSSESPLTNCSRDGASEAKDLKYPTELITSCVSTLLMIQKCTDRQYPPAEVASILDNAVTSMQPCCPQNLTVYREIEMCMGRIKTQILALIPS